MLFRSDLGAIALFGEKYGEEVRVIQFEDSIEFCGGIHVPATGSIGIFKIISEGSIASGIRRIEAWTGAKVEKMIYEVEDTLKGLRSLFNNTPNLVSTIEKHIEENSKLKKTVEDFLKEKEIMIKQNLIKKIEVINGVKVIRFVSEIPAESVKNIAFQLRSEIEDNLFFVAGSSDSGKPMLTVMMSDDLVESGLKAGDLVRQAAKLIQGGGGGQAHFATAGGKNKDGLHEAVAKVLELAKLS